MKQIIAEARKISIPPKKMQGEKTKIAKLAFELVRKQVSKFPEIIGIEFGGSYAKGTWLPNMADIDIFIKFKKTTLEKNFVDVSKKVGFASMKKYHPYVRYSEHPYVEATISGTKVNVVPCYDVELGKWKSSADRSPYHTKFMLESLTGLMKNEVRILKKFLISNQIYGSEIAKQGISGYVTEVLILNHGSFLDAISAISEISLKQVIGKPSKDFDTPLVIIDPIDSNRNLGAAISTENLGKFVLLSREYLKKPSLSFFKIKTVKKASNSNIKKVVIVKFSFKQRSPDIIWGQIKRAVNSLSTQLEKSGFKVLREKAVTDEKTDAWLLFLMDSLRINEDFVRDGPDFFLKNDSAIFIEKNSKKSKLLWIDKNRKILSLQKRPINDSKKFLQDLLKNHLNSSGIPKGLKSDFKKGFQVMEAKKVKGKSIKEAISDLVSTDAKIFSSNR